MSEQHKQWLNQAFPKQKWASWQALPIPEAASHVIILQRPDQQPQLRLELLGQFAMLQLDILNPATTLQFLLTQMTTLWAPDGSNTRFPWNPTNMTNEFRQGEKQISLTYHLGETDPSSIMSKTIGQTSWIQSPDSINLVPPKYRTAPTNYLAAISKLIST